jgi:hypothetical protein
MVRRILFRLVARLSIFVETIKANRGAPVVFLYTSSMLSLLTCNPRRKTLDISSLGSLLAAGSMRLYADAASAHQAAVFENLTAADRSHALTESVFPDVFFLFRLIDAFGHTEA